LHGRRRETFHGLYMRPGALARGPRCSAAAAPFSRPAGGPRRRTARRPFRRCRRCCRGR
jgi:hypothetical protein